MSLHKNEKCRRARNLQLEKIWLPIPSKYITQLNNIIRNVWRSQDQTSQRELIRSTSKSQYQYSGWHKLFKPSSRALRIFPIYEDFWGFLWSQRVKMRPPIGGVKAVLSPQSSLLNPQSSVLSPQKCSQKLDLPACQYCFKCSKCSNVYGTSGIQVIPCRI